MRRMAGLWAALLLVLALTPVQAGAVELPIRAEAALLMEKETGQVLYAQNEHEALEPASVTKVMTLLLTMEAIEKGSLHYDDMVTVSAYAASMGGSHVYLSEGEQITVDDLLKAVCVASGNDAAVALAECVAGVTELFVEQMNTRAKELGMTDTHFVNCTGLPAEGHVTSAWDIALMSRELIEKHPDIRRYTTIWMDTLRDGKSQLVNTNKLVRHYKGATGLKTGTTQKAGHCLSATAQRDGMGLVAVILGCSTTDERFGGARKMLDYGFASYGIHTPQIDQNQLQPVKVLRGVEPQVDITVETPAPVLVKKGQEKAIVTTIELAEDLEAPVLQGQVVGEVILKLDDKEVATYPIRAAKAVGAVNFGVAFRWLFDALLG